MKIFMISVFSNNVYKSASQFIPFFEMTCTLFFFLTEGTVNSSWIELKCWQITRTNWQGPAWFKFKPQCTHNFLNSQLLVATVHNEKSVKVADSHLTRWMNWNREPRQSVSRSKGNYICTSRNLLIVFKSRLHTPSDHGAEISCQIENMDLLVDKI